MDLTATALIAAVTAFLSILGIAVPKLAAWDVVLILSIVYVIALLASLLILRFSFLVLAVKDESINWQNLLVVILFRDIVALSMTFVPFFFGEIIAFSIWVGVLRYRFKMEWSKAALVAIIAGIIPLILAMFTLIGLIGLAVA